MTYTRYFECMNDFPTTISPRYESRSLISRTPSPRRKYSGFSSFCFRFQAENSSALSFPPLLSLSLSYSFSDIDWSIRPRFQTLLLTLVKLSSHTLPPVSSWKSSQLSCPRDSERIRMRSDRRSFKNVRLRMIRLQRVLLLHPIWSINR